MRDQAQTARAQGFGRFDQRGFQLARGIGNDQHLLEKGTDKDDGNLGAVVNPEHSDRQCAKCRGWQVAEKFDKGLMQAAQAGVGAASYNFV